MLSKRHFALNSTFRLLIEMLIIYDSLNNCFLLSRDWYGYMKRVCKITQNIADCQNECCERYYNLLVFL